MALFLFSYSAQANTWTQVNEDGFGDNNTSNTGSLAVFDGYIYAGASNSRIGIQIWRTNDGTNWAKVNENGFGDTSNSGSYAMAAYGGYLYVSTYNYEGGAKIWRTNDGTAWTQVIGDELDLNDEGYDENSLVATMPILFML